MERCSCGLRKKIEAQLKDFRAIAKYDPLEDPIRAYVEAVVIPTLENLLK